MILSKSVSNSMIAYTAISDRVLYVRIRAAPFNISLIEVYGPTTEATDEEVEEFYDQIRTALEISQSQDVVFRDATVTVNNRLTVTVSRVFTGNRYYG